ncbi:MAG: L-2-hydroxyglutarate oxidase [Candidatus Sericytochromatia bacterium]|nr:L-2-hydroxyglutarate oxidase [Candidatus Tanganyikabacteria bacterium]
MSASFDYAVVGGGIVGLAVAFKLGRRFPSARIALIEKEHEWATHQTGRNSGVIHSGLYYKPGSLKADLCRLGRARLEAFCEREGVPFRRCGKLVVATRPGEVPRLDALAERGLAHGLAVTRLDPAGIRGHEPHVTGVAGLWVPETGIVDYRQVAARLAALAQEQGAEPRLGFEVAKIRAGSEVYRLECRSGDVLEARFLINCAGLFSDRIARLAGLGPAARVVPFRGEYYAVAAERRDLVRGLVYPVPDPAFPFLGVHLTRMIDGTLHAGPNAVLALKREGYAKTDFALRDALDALLFPGFWRLASRYARAGLEEMWRSTSKDTFVAAVRRLVPDLRAPDLTPCAAGVRAQALLPSGDLVDDFLIVPGDRALHVCNAPSPAATSALAIADHVVDRVIA